MLDAHSYNTMDLVHSNIDGSFRANISVKSEMDLQEYLCSERMIDDVMHLIHDIDQILSIVVYLWLQGFPIRVHTTKLISHDHELKYLLRNMTHIIQNAIDGVFEREIANRTIWHPHMRHVFTIIQEHHSYALRCSQWCSLTPLKSIPTNKIYVYQTYLYINNFIWN